jgi:uncharacterized membrane protein YdjX (TVP38/TMEM64 family)
MGAGDFLIVSTAGRLLGTSLLTIGGTALREGRYGLFFTLLGIGIGAVLFVMIYRERIEAWLRRRKEKRRSKKT